jgi:multiple sugar transport system ATP-binding protein
MNLIEGEIKNRKFTSTLIEVSGLSIDAEGPIKLGVRPEDCTFVAAKFKSHHMTGEVYDVEPTGDMNYLTLRVGDNNLEIKADRDYRSELGLTEKVAFDTERLYFFEAQSGQRVR